MALGADMSMAHPRNYAGIKFAWIDDFNTIRILVDSNIHPDDIKILDHHGEFLSLDGLIKDKNQVLATFDNNLNLSKNFQIIYHNEKVWAYPSQKLLNSSFVTTKELGARIVEHNLSLRLWSPTATEVSLILYGKDAKTSLGKRSLKRTSNGAWEGDFGLSDFNLKSFDGLFYQYEITAFGETHLALDPYAKSMAAFDPSSEDKIGKAAIVNIDMATKYQHPKKLSFANETDFIGYEAHVHDFTIDPNLNIDDILKGSYKGFTKIIPHIKDLGVTHVQFMPLQSFYTVKEVDHSFQGVDVPLKKINYNWGYDPQNYFSPDGWYSLKPQDPYERITEVKDLFSALHNNGIGVIIDVVYNHLFDKNTLENVAPGCYLRMNEQGDISTATGAGYTLESRNLMSRRLIIDSLKHWQNYYGVDGFRFDLMSFTDQDTMLEIRKALGDQSILYGEAWNFTDLPFEQATTKTNFPHQASLSVFNDSARDSYAGRMEGKGFVQGVFSEAARSKTGIIGALKKFPDPNNEVLEGDYDRFASEPFETINYLAIHDGFTLWDKINLSNGGDKSSREKIVRLAFAMLFTSQGRIVIHGGDEFGRSKPLSPNDPHPDRAHTSEVVDPENGISFFHENSYSSPDNTNHIDWSRGQDFKELNQYVKGLIKLRRSTPSLRYNHATSIQNGLHFIGEHKIYNKKLTPSLPQHFIAYLIDNTLENSVASKFVKSNYKNILVIHNADLNELTLKVREIKDTSLWDVLVDQHSAGINPIKNSSVKLFTGEIKIPAQSTAVLGGME
jgi:pullulanase